MSNTQPLPPQFWRLIATRALYTFATQMQAILIGWSVYALTHSPIALGLVGLAEAIPALSLALKAGDMVDQGDPLKIYRRVLLANTASCGLLLSAYLGHAYFVAAPATLLVALYTASFLTGTVRAFAQPCMFSLVPRMVPRAQLTQSAASMSASMQVARVAGPACGGLTYAFLGATGSLAIVFVLLGIAQAMLTSMTLVLPAAPTSGPVLTSRQRLLEGLAFVAKQPVLLAALSLDMVSVLFGGVTAILPIFAEEVLRVGSMGLGLMRAAPAVGATIAALALARMEIRPRAGAYMLLSVAGFGACILAFACSTSLVLSCALLALSGAFDGVSMMVRTLIVQLTSPDAMRGRISAVNSMFVGSSNEIGELESGLAAAHLGTVPSVLFGGAMCMATVLTMAALSPRLRRLNLLDAPQTP